MTEKFKDRSADQKHVEKSYLMLRKIVGFLGVATPFYLPIASFACAGETRLRPSISHYYHGPMQNEFVSIVCVIGVFLIAYRGYDWVDNWMGYIAGISAIGVALCPRGEGPIGTVHLISAAVLFVMLAIFSGCRFVKTLPGCKVKPGTAKSRRNWVYRGSASVILASLIACVVWMVAGNYSKCCPDDSTFLFWAESVMLVAFGVSWFVKGDTLLRDPSPGD